MGLSSRTTTVFELRPHPSFDELAQLAGWLAYQEFTVTLNGRYSVMWHGGGSKQARSVDSSDPVLIHTDGSVEAWFDYEDGM